MHVDALVPKGLPIISSGGLLAVVLYRHWITGLGCAGCETPGRLATPNLCLAGGEHEIISNRSGVACSAVKLRRCALAGEVVTYYYTDAQGTPLATTDAQGNITSTADYRPYAGQALGQSSGGPGYTGHEYDADTDLIYMQSRYYDPEVGRFLGVDSARQMPGSVYRFNEFSYANNNPLINIDPDGRQSTEDYNRAASCPVPCSLVRDSDGTFLVVPTVAAGKSAAAISIGKSMSSLDQASRSQLASGADAAQAGMDASSIATIPAVPVSAGFAMTGEVFGALAFVLDPTAERGLNVASMGLSRMAKYVTKGSHSMTTVVDLVERDSQLSDIEKATKDEKEEEYRQKQETQHDDVGHNQLNN